MDQIKEIRRNMNFENETNNKLYLTLLFDFLSRNIVENRHRESINGLRNRKCIICIIY